MIEYDNRNWWHLLFTLQGSVITAIFSRIIFVGVFATFIACLNHWQWLNFEKIPSTPWTVAGVALGLLLVFRTNASYDRYWEGRKLWGGVVNSSRNLAAGIVSYIQTPDPSALAQQRHLVHLICAFPYLMKQRLRGQKNLDEIAHLITPAERDLLNQAAHLPSVLAMLIAQQLQHCIQQGRLAEVHLLIAHRHLSELVDYLGGCERIRNTPLPIAYVLHLKRFLALFCLTIPFALVASLGGWTPLVAALVTYAFLGIDEIGVEIEDPFGDDPNDLPLDKLCQTIEDNLQAMLKLAPETAQLSPSVS